MPECYTHSVIAFQAMARNAQVVTSQQAFIAGANGPDVLSFYKAWSKGKNTKFSELSKMLHSEKTGEFLCTLVSLATTQEQQSYVLGYLSHYAADCIINPYIEAMCKKGQPYNQKNGRHWLASSIDSSLAMQNFKTNVPPFNLSVPKLVAEDLAQIATLLHEAISKVYEVEIPIVKFSDAFHDFTKLHHKLVKKGTSRVLIPVMHLRIFSWKSLNYLESKIQPALPLKPLPSVWENPYTKMEYNITLEEIILQAAQGSQVCMKAAIDYWLGRISVKDLQKIVGDNNMLTGQPIYDTNMPKATQTIAFEEAKKSQMLHKQVQKRVSEQKAVHEESAEIFSEQQELLEETKKTIQKQQQIHEQVKRAPRSAPRRRVSSAARENFEKNDVNSDVGSKG